MLLPFAAGLDDVLKGKPVQLSTDEMRAALESTQQLLSEKRQAEAQAALDAGNAFLEENKARRA